MSSNNNISDKLPTIELTPIGIVHSKIKQPWVQGKAADLTPEEHFEKIKIRKREIQNAQAELIIFTPWVELLDGVEGFSHLLVLYWPHLADPEKRKLPKVHPMGRKDLPRQGIFATCSPSRPNSVLVTAVRLIKRKRNVLRVEGLEAVNGSPIIDIKPYVKNYYRVENPIVPYWMEKIQSELEYEDTDLKH